MKVGTFVLLLFIVFVTAAAGHDQRKRESSDLSGGTEPSGVDPKFRFPENGTTDEAKKQEGQSSIVKRQTELSGDDDDGYRILTHPNALRKLARLILEAAELFQIQITDSSIFPSHAKSHHRYHECRTPRNNPGRCAHVEFCIRPKFLHHFDHFMNQVCYIDGRYLGVCCPEGDMIEVSDHPTEEFISSIIDGYPKEHPGRHPIRRPGFGGGGGHKPGHRPAVHHIKPHGHHPVPPHRGAVPKPPVKPLHMTSNAGALYADCGLNFKTRIIGGQQADPRDWIWMAALLRQNQDQFCGGALISLNYVITAAHCLAGLEAPQVKVRLGEYDFSKTTSPDRQDFAVAAIKRHPSFNRSTNANDLALLKLATPATLTDFIRPICLPEPNKDFNGVQSTVAGWGTLSYGGKSSPVLRQVKVPVWKNADCAKSIPGRISEVFLCAGPRAGGRDACQGDSGGPLMAENGARRWSIIGIVSWGVRCGEPNLPGVYTRVNKYVDWIKKNAQ